MALGPTGRYRLLGGAVLVLTFGVGGLAGAAVERVLDTREPDRLVSVDPAAETGTIDCDRYRQRRRGPYGSLGLSDEQAASIDAVFESQRSRMDQFWADAGPRMNAILDETRADVREILTEEQRTQYDSNRAARQRRQQEQERQDSIRRAEIRRVCNTDDGPPSGPGRHP